MERAGVTGTLDIHVLVDEKGGVLQAKADNVNCRPRGPNYERLLRDAAVKSAASWRFEPATKAGVPVRVWKTYQGVRL